MLNTTEGEFSFQGCSHFPHNVLSVKNPLLQWRMWTSNSNEPWRQRFWSLLHFSEFQRGWDRTLHKIKPESLLRLTCYWAKRRPRAVTWILSITGLQQQLKRLLTASVCSHYQVMVVHRQHEETAGRRKSMHTDTAAIRQIFLEGIRQTKKHNDKMWNYTWDLQRLQPKTWFLCTQRGLLEKVKDFITGDRETLRVK